MSDVVSSIDIRAPVETVWKTLTDLHRFSEWNPFIREASGDLRVGGSVRVRVRPSAMVPLVFHAQVLKCDEPRELRWRGHVLASWLASGDHTFTLEPQPGGGTRFVQREIFGGVLPRLAGRLLEREARRGFDEMNQALKERAEGARSAPTGASCAPS